MIDPDAQLAPPPAEKMEICRAENVGWYIKHDNAVVACFSDARAMAGWIEDVCAPLDPQPPQRQHEPMPAVLDNDAPPPVRRSMWSIIAGGRRE